MADKKILVKLPTAVFGLAGRYANALYMAASKASSLDAVEGDLKEFKKAIDTDAKFRRFVLDPSIARKTKSQAMAKAFAKSNEVTRKFVGVLADNGRLLEVDKVLADFSTLMKAHRKEVSAVVTTAEPMEPAQLTSVKDALKNFIKTDEKLLVDTKVNPALLGGLTVTVGDKYVDLSIVKRINDIKRLLDEPLA